MWPLRAQAVIGSSSAPRPCWVLLARSRRTHFAAGVSPFPRQWYACSTTFNYYLQGCIPTLPSSVKHLVEKSEPHTQDDPLQDNFHVEWTEEHNEWTHSVSWITPYSWLMFRLLFGCFHSAATQELWRRKQPTWPFPPPPPHTHLALQVKHPPSRAFFRRQEKVYFHVKVRQWVVLLAVQCRSHREIQ